MEECVIQSHGLLENSVGSLENSVHEDTLER